MTTWVLLLLLTLPSGEQVITRQAVSSEAMCHKVASTIRTTPPARVSYICTTLDKLTPEARATVGVAVVR